MNRKQTYLALFLLSVSSGLHAQSLETATAIESQTNQASAHSQQQIDQSAAARLELMAEFEQLQSELDNLNVYRDHLARLVENQNSELESLNQQIDGIKETRQGVIPLMYQMIDGLKAIVSQDKPIQLERRQQRIAKLEALMGQADVSDAEKYRRILEAYQIEVDYGSKLGIFQGLVQLPGQSAIQAEQLYLGRIALVARSLDKQHYWAWNQQQSSWQVQPLQYTSDIDKAFSIAAKQAAPSLLSLPVSVDVEGK